LEGLGVRHDADVAPADDDVVVRPAAVADKPIVHRLLQLYMHDFSELTGADVGPHGEFDYPYFDHYWTEPARHPFLFEVDGALAGLAFVRSGAPHDMAEFFVLRKHRRRDVGRQAAALVLRRFPGEWQVRQISANPRATAFWRAAIPYPFTDARNDDGPLQRFHVPGA
jgi:predicted acetyltransferase